MTRGKQLQINISWSSMQVHGAASVALIGGQAQPPHPSSLHSHTTPLSTHSLLQSKS